MKPPSPTRATTGWRGEASFAPIAAAGAYPMVAMPPLVMKVSGRRVKSCWPAPFLFQPTSVTTMVSSGSAWLSSNNSRAGWMGCPPSRWLATSSPRHACFAASSCAYRRD